MIPQVYFKIPKMYPEKLKLCTAEYGTRDEKNKTKTKTAVTD